MNYTQKALGLLIGVIAILVLFWLTIYAPKSNTLEELQIEAKELDKKLVEVQVKQKMLPQILIKIENTRERLERLEVQYPRTIELVYQVITDAAGKEGFNISKRDTAEIPVEDEETALREYEIKISAHCQYQILGEFLDRIVNSRIIISISGLAIVADSNMDSPRAGENDLRVEMQLTTYLSR